MSSALANENEQDNLQYDISLEELKEKTVLLPSGKVTSAKTYSMLKYRRI